MFKFKSLHPLIKTAIGVFVLEFFIAPIGTAFFAKYLSRPLKMFKDVIDSWGFLPHGLMIGTSIGMVGALYFLRGKSPDWYKNFDVQRARFDHEKISIQSILREYVKGDTYQFVRSKQFYNCKFYGPAMAFFTEDVTIGPGNVWGSMGTPLSLGKGETVTGCVGFQGCHFEGCSFEHITPIIPASTYDVFFNTFPESQRRMMKPLIETSEQPKLIEDKSKPKKRVAPNKTAPNS
jgi:hypothetical protein